MSNAPKHALWTIQEVADYLRVNKSTIYRMAQSGEIKGVKVAHHWRFMGSYIESLVE